MAEISKTHFESLRQIESGYWWYLGRLHLACEMLSKWWSAQASVVPLRYADLGCGTGGLALELGNEFPLEKAWLLDKTFQVSRSLQDSRFEFLQVDLEKELPLPEGQLDLISCMDVLEHVENDENFLRRVRKVLRPGGGFLISVPAYESLYSDWDRNLGHHRRYSRKELKAKLERNGFRVLAMTYLWFPFFPLGLWRRFSKFQGREEFPEVPLWLNGFLKLYGAFERLWGKFLPVPMGTSLMAIGVAVMGEPPLP